MTDDEVKTVSNGDEIFCSTKKSVILTRRNASCIRDNRCRRYSQSTLLIDWILDDLDYVNGTSYTSCELVHILRDLITKLAVLWVDHQIHAWLRIPSCSDCCIYLSCFFSVTRPISRRRDKKFFLFFSPSFFYSYSLPFTWGIDPFDSRQWGFIF